MIRSFVVTLFLILAVVGSFGLRRMYGAHWGILPFDLLVVCWAAACLCDAKQVCGLRNWKLTRMDIIVLLFICCVMHGMAIPAVHTVGRPGRLSQPARSVTPQVPLSPTDGGLGAESSKY